MALDFSLLGQGPQFGNALTAYKTGQEDRRQTSVRNALMQYKDNPEMAAPDLIAAGELETGLKLQDRGKAQRQDAERKRLISGYGADPAASRQGAMATGDVDLINQISQMDENQRKVAATNADNLASVGMAVMENYKTPEERRAWAMQPQNTEFLGTMGFKPEQIAAFPWDDAALKTVVGQALTVTERIAQMREERAAEFEGKKFEETVRHNKATEGVAGQNADSRRITATRPRASGGGGGGMKLPTGFVLDGQ